MGYGHADDGTAPPWYTRPEARKALAERDIGAVYRLLYRDGVSQREIARRTGQSQSEVSEIMHGGRQVRDVTVLERIADGLGVPHLFLRLLTGAPGVDGQDGAYGGEVTVTETSEEVGAEMLRRHLIALGGVTMAGATVAKLGELLAELPGPPPLPLPSRLGPIHVAKVRDLTRRLGQADNHGICDAEVIGAAAAWATQQLDVPGTEPVKRALMTAVAELHIEAGWAAFDVGLYRRALYHYARTLELAIEAGDAYLQALALNYAGITTVEHGEPNDGLKLLQLGRVKAWDIPPDDQRAVVVGENGRAAVEATALADSATAQADLGHLDAADTDLATARELWRPTRSDPYGDLDRPAAGLAMRRGRLDLAETLAAASVRRWEGGSPISRTQSGILLATIHVKAGEPDGLRLAHSAITSVPKLNSHRARRRLEPLAAALEARLSPDAKELARMTRQVAATRA